MKIYALTSNGIVGDVMMADNTPALPPTPDGTPVIAIEITREEEESIFSKRWNGQFWEDRTEPEEKAIDPIAERLDKIEAAIAASSEMQEFYAAVCEETGLIQ